MGHSCDEYGQSTWRKPGDMLVPMSCWHALVRRLAPCCSDSTMPVGASVNGGGDSTICLEGMNDLPYGALSASLHPVNSNHELFRDKSTNHRIIHQS